ncbi:MAG: hypothetical protein WDO74_37250 [Pseudomonadota bacterium]
MEQSFPTIVSAPQPSLGARLTSPETRGAAHELARLGAGLGLAALGVLYGMAGALSGVVVYRSQPGRDARALGSALLSAPHSARAAPAARGRRSHAA